MVLIRKYRDRKEINLKGKSYFADININWVKDEKYQDGVKYSMYLNDKITYKAVIGIDNHYPKSHHYHIKEKEISFEYESINDVLRLFRTLIEENT